MAAPESFVSGAPKRNAAAVVPSNTMDLPQVSLLYVGVTGDVKVDTAFGATVTFTAHPVGYMPVQVRRVYATGTTATNIVALYD